MKARRRPWSSRAVSAAVALTLAVSGTAFWPGLAPAASAAGVSVAPTASATWTTAEDFVTNASTTGVRTTRSNLATSTVPGAARAGGDLGKIVAGANHAVAIRTDGSVFAIGADDNHKCDVQEWTNIVDADVGDDHTLGLRADGTVVAVGYASSDGRLNVSGWSGITDVAAGRTHTVGLRSDGTVVAVGSNASGQCNVSTWTGVVAISAGSSHTIGLKSDGTVVATGSNSSGQLNVTEWSGITAVSAGDTHTVGLTAEGTVVAVGSSFNSALAVGAWTDVVSIEAGRSTTLGVRADGSVLATGRMITPLGGYGDANTWTEIAAVSAASDYAMGLRTDGTTVVVGRLPSFASQFVWGPWLWDHLEPTSLGVDHAVAIVDSTRQTVIEDTDYWWEPTASQLYPVAAVAAGYHFTAYKYAYGQTRLTDQGTVSLTEFAGTGYTNTPVSLSAGRGSLYGVTVDGGVATYSGISGVGDWVDMVEVAASAGTAISASDIVIGRHPDGTCVATGPVATAVAGWRDIVDVAAGHAHAVGLRADGTVVATGDNRYHQCDVSDWTDIVQVAAGYDHTVGLRSDGTVVAVGDRYGDELDVHHINDRARSQPMGPEPVVWIDAGTNMTMGVIANGEALIVGDGWGELWPDIATKRPATAWIGGSGEQVGLRFDPGFEPGAEWAALTASYPALAPGQSVKFAVRTSEDGVTYSEPLGYNGQPIDWTDRTGNYLGRAYGDTAPRTSLEAVPDARYLDIVVRIETRDAMTSPILRDVTASCREKDVTIPTVTSDAVASYGDSATVTIAASDDFGLASISYRLDGEATVTVAASTTSATKAVTTGTLGEHSLEFWTADLSGNVSEHGSASFIVVDASAPVVTSDALASYDETATLTISATENFELVSISYRLDAETTVTVPATGFSVETSLTTTVLGEHTVSYWAEDAAGNVCAPSSATFVVLDAVAPTISCETSGRYDDVAVFDVTAADNRGLASISYRLDGEATVSVPVSGPTASAPVSVTGLGEHVLEYWAIDAGGNESARGTATFAVIDATAPVVISDALDTYRDAATITLSASDDRALTNVSYRINGEATVTVEASAATATVAVSVTALGEYVLEFWATDGSANESEPQQVFFAVLDGTPPVVTIDAVDTYEDLAVLMISATDETALGSISYSLDGAPAVTRPKTGTLGMLVTWTAALGDHTLEYWTTDAVGNESAHKTAVFTVEPAVLPMDPPPQGLSRLYGEDRYGTAVRASMEMFPGGAGVVVIASGEDWPDALGGSALAGVVDGPLLLTRSQGLPDEVRDEIVRLGATKVYILGGTGAVSTIAEAELRGVMGAANVRRIGGADRYETARLIANEVIWLQGSAYDGTALVASGGTFADALAASPLAAANGWPILLANPQSGGVGIPASVTDAVVLGGSGAVSERMQIDLESALGAAHVTRIGGVDRYDTAVLIAAYGAGCGASWECVGIATGSHFPDGLAAGAAIGERGGLLLLTTPDALYPGAGAALAANAGVVKSVYIVGGEGAVSAAVEAAAYEALGFE